MDFVQKGAYNYYTSHPSVLSYMSRVPEVEGTERGSDVTMGTALGNKTCSLLLCSCSQDLAWEPPNPVLTLPWAPGSYAGQPSVSWGPVSPQKTR